MIPVAFGLGALIAKVATVTAIPRAVQALRAFFSGPETREGISTPEKSPQTRTPSAIPENGTKEVIQTFNALNQKTTPGTNLYDAKGQTTDKDGRTFEWDDDGRMTAIVDGTHRSEMAYDGLGRRIKIAEFDNGTLTSKKLYWWLGGEIVCERDGIAPGFPLTKRYFGQGVVVGAERLYYTMDQLGSVRELVDSSGVVRADYRYTPYGERTKVGGDLDSDFGFAGLFHHGPSGLDLATYRTYDSKMGRWISRDPLGEGVDYNLYRYCGNDPIGHFDSTGLFKVVATGPMGERLKKALQRLRDKLKDKEREKNCNLTETGFTAPDLLRVIEDESITVDFGGKTGDPGHTFAETFTGADESGAIGSATQVYDDAAALTDEQLEGVLGHEGAHVLLNERRLKAQAIIKDNQRFKNAMKGAGINTMHPPHIFNTIDNAFPTGISYPNPEMPIFTP